MKSIHSRLMALSLGAVCASFAAFAQDNTVTIEADTADIIYQKGRLEVISTSSNPLVLKAITEARPVEPKSNPVPKFTIKSTNNKFMLSIGGMINPIMGYDIGNNLYNTDAGSSFVVGDIPVPALTGHKGDFFINALNGNLDFTVVGFGGTKDQITGYVKIAANGNTKPIILKRAYIKWRHVQAGLMTSMAVDGLAAQPNLIDPQGPNGELNTASYQIGYVSPSYNGFGFGAAVEMPTFESSNGVYRGHDYKSWVGHKIDADVDQLVPDIPLYIQYQPSEQNRVRFTAILRNFQYQNMLDRRRENLFAWGTMLSGNFSFYKPLTFNFQAVYGKGIGNYIQDLQGRPLSFTPVDHKPGKMEANPMMGLVFGASYNATSKLQFNAVGSYCRIWNVEPYAMDGDGMVADANGMNVYAAGANNYKSGVYVAANCFYNFNSYLSLGVEYLYGRHYTYGCGAANDSRVQTQLCFTF